MPRGNDEEFPGKKPNKRQGQPPDPSGGQAARDDERGRGPPRRNSPRRAPEPPAGVDQLRSPTPESSSETSSSAGPPQQRDWDDWSSWDEDTEGQHIDEQSPPLSVHDRSPVDSGSESDETAHEERAQKREDWKVQKRERAQKRLNAEYDKAKRRKQRAADARARKAAEREKLKAEFRAAEEARRDRAYDPRREDELGEHERRAARAGCQMCC